MVSIAIMGHGVVGSGVAEILLTHKQKLFARLGEEIYIKKVLDLREFPDSPIADRFTKDFEAMERAGAPAAEIEAFGSGRLRLAVVEGDTEKGSLMAGQSAGLVHAVEPAAVIIESIMNEMQQICENMTRCCK